MGMVTAVFYKLLGMSLTASYCILAVLLLRLCMKRAPKIFSYVLWAVVGFRLICPVLPESPFSLMGRTVAESSETIAADSAAVDYFAGGRPEAAAPEAERIIYEEEKGTAHGEENGSGGREGNHLQSDTTPDNSRQTNDSKENGSQENALENGSPKDVDTENMLQDGSARAESPAGNPGQSGTDGKRIVIKGADVCAFLWLGVFLLLCVYCVFSYLHLKKKLRKAACPEGFYQGIPVFRARGIGTPFVFGLTRPTIYLPEGLTEQQRAQCLAHEGIHVRRRDNLVKQTAFLLACLHWFNPLVWLSFYLMSCDLEMSCDEQALKSPELADRKAYSETLLDLSAERAHFGGCPLAFGAGSARARIKNIMNYKKPAFWVVLCCVAGIVLCAAGLLTDPVGFNPEENFENTVTPETGTVTAMNAETEEDMINAKAPDEKAEELGVIYASGGTGQIPIYRELDSAGGRPVKYLPADSIVQLSSCSNSEFAAVEGQGYARMEDLWIDVPENTDRALAYWIAKTWCGALLAEDGKFLYQMAQGAEGDFYFTERYYEPKTNNINFGLQLSRIEGYGMALVEREEDGRQEPDSVEIYYYYREDQHGPEISVARQTLDLAPADYRNADGSLRSVTLRELLTQCLHVGDISVMDTIDSYSDFCRAYVDGSRRIHVYDYQESEEKQFQMLADSSTAYHTPEAAVENLLRLRGGSAEVISVKGEEGQWVHYCFADGAAVNIPVLCRDGMLYLPDCEKMQSDHAIVLSAAEREPEDCAVLLGKLTDYLNRWENNYFLLQNFKAGQIDLDFLFYDGAGLENAEVEAAEAQKLRKILGTDEYYHFTGEQVNAFLMEKLGVPLDEIRYGEGSGNTLRDQWIYLEQYDTYSLQVNGDILYTEIVCTGLTYYSDGMVRVDYRMAGNTAWKSEPLVSGSLYLSPKYTDSSPSRPEEYYFAGNIITEGSLKDDNMENAGLSAANNPSALGLPAYHYGVKNSREAMEKCAVYQEIIDGLSEWNAYAFVMLPQANTQKYPTLLVTDYTYEDKSENTAHAAFYCSVYHYVPEKNKTGRKVQEIGAINGKRAMSLRCGEDEYGRTALYTAEYNYIACYTLSVDGNELVMTESIKKEQDASGQTRYSYYKMQYGEQPIDRSDLRESDGEQLYQAMLDRYHEAEVISFIFCKSLAMT